MPMFRGGAATPVNTRGGDRRGVVREGDKQRQGTSSRPAAKENPEPQPKTTK